MSKPRAETYIQALDAIKSGRLTRVQDMQVASYPSGLFQLVVYCDLELWLCHYFMGEDHTEMGQAIEWRKAEAVKLVQYIEKGRA